MPATMKLYEISGARDILDAWLAETEGEMTPELEQLLAELDGQTDEKIERVALYVRERQAHAAAVKEEAQRLAAIQKREEKAAESLKAYLHREMQRLGKSKVNGLLCTVAVQNNPPSVVCDLTQDDLRMHYNGSVTGSRVAQFIVEVPASYRLDKDVVKQAHKAGEPLPPEVRIEVGTSLRIR